MPEPGPANRHLLHGVMWAIGIWGGMLALGATLFGYDPQSGQVHFAPSLLRGAIVAGCVAAYLGGWTALLRLRR